MSKPEESVRARVVNWFLAFSQNLSLAEAGVGVLKESGVRGGRLLFAREEPTGQDWKTVEDMRDLLWVVRTDAEGIAGALLLPADAGKVRGFAECYQLRLQRPGRERINRVATRLDQFRSSRRELDDRLEAVKLMHADIKSLLVAKGYFDDKPGGPLHV